MQESELQQYLLRNYPQENACCEWKEFKNLKNSFCGDEKNDVISYVSAIANMEGGHLVIGVHDSSLEIVGTDTYNYDRQKAILRLTERCVNLSTEGLDIGGGGEAQQPGDLHSGGILRIDDHVDAQVPLQLRQARGVLLVPDPGDGAQDIDKQQDQQTDAEENAGNGHHIIGSDRFDDYRDKNDDQSGQHKPICFIGAVPQRPDGGDENDCQGGDQHQMSQRKRLDVIQNAEHM